jgi:hypothetical protein
MTNRCQGNFMAMAMRRLVILVAATLLAFVSWLGLGAGIGMADPYDDGDGTVDVAPDVVAEEPQQEAPEADPGPAEEPAPAEAPAEPAAPAEEPGVQPQEPVPGAETGGGSPAGEPDQAPASAGSGAEDPSAPGTQDDSSSEPQSPASGDAAEDHADEITPDVLSADAGDTKQALDSKPEVAEVRQADETTITEMRSTVETALSSSSSLQVTQWSSSWVRYSQYYQPLIANPFPVPIQLAYTYANLPYILTIPPLAQSLLNVPQPGVYSFTALVPNESGGVANVSVGSFSGGGYVPKPGQPPPPKPAALVTYDNVLVRFNLAGVQYEPVVVKKVVDLGDDAKTGTRKVLLDAETPAWGTWGRTSSGQREFTVTSTQSLPGLTAPASSAPPGYKLTVASASAPSSATSTLTWVALGLGVLAVLAVVAVVVLVRRRRSPGEA